MNEQDEEPLYAELAASSLLLGVSLTPRQLDEVKTFCLAILDYSTHTNLVGKAELAVLLKDHVLDSLSLVPFLLKALSQSGPSKLLDVGSGAGFPGVVLCIALPEIHATLVESSGKKCRFLTDVIKSLKIDNRVEINSTRAEELGHDLAYRARYSFATARAVGTFDLSAELVMPFLAMGGKFFAQKSLAQKEDEVRRAKKCLPLLGGKLLDVHKFDLDILGKERVLLIAEKHDITPAPYARVFTKIKSEPLVKS